MVDHNAISHPAPSPSEIHAHLALKMSRRDLDELFLRSPAGDLPNGRARGTALIGSGPIVRRTIATLARLLFWQGKDFDPARSELLNRLGPFGVRAIRAAVRTEESELDAKPCIVLDYSKTSTIARPIRDEIRCVGEHQYLGVVFVAGRQLPLHFFLNFSAQRT